MYFSIFELQNGTSKSNTLSYGKEPTVSQASMLGPHAPVKIRIDDVHAEATALADTAITK